MKGAIYYASELLSYWFCNAIRPTNDSPLHSLTFSLSLHSLFLSDYSTPSTPTHICHFDSPGVLGLQGPPLSPPFSYIKECYCFEQSRLERRERERVLPLSSDWRSQTGDESLRGRCQELQEKGKNQTEAHSEDL